jgi:hypothetical protein
MTVFAGFFSGAPGGSGSVLPVWIDVAPNSVLTITVGAGGRGQTQTPFLVQATNGEATTVTLPNGTVYSAGGGIAANYGIPGSSSPSSPSPTWNLSPGYYRYGLPGAGGNAFPSGNAPGLDGGSGLVLIEWID